MTRAEVILVGTQDPEFAVARRQQGARYLDTDLVLRYERVAREWVELQTDLRRAFEAQEGADREPEK